MRPVSHTVTYTIQHWRDEFQALKRVRGLGALGVGFGAYISVDLFQALKRVRGLLALLHRTVKMAGA